MRIPCLAGRPLPLAAVIAFAGLIVAGCVLLAVAAFSGRAELAAAPSATATLSERTPVPTVIHTATPSPTNTERPTATATITETEPPTDTPAPEESETPTVTRTATRRPTSSTPLPTAPPPATATPTVASVVSGGGGHGVTGQLSLCNPKPSYAAKSDVFEGERICVNELITNTGGETLTYGVLGVRAQNLTGGPSYFQSSWRGDLAVPAGGNGPTGSGWQDGLYLTEGSYSLSLSICYSSVDDCVGTGGNWETLTPGITVQVVPWTP